VGLGQGGRKTSNILNPTYASDNESKTDSGEVQAVGRVSSAGAFVVGVKSTTKEPTESKGKADVANATGTTDPQALGVAALEDQSRIRTAVPSIDRQGRC